MPFFGIGMKTDLFQSYGHCWVFQICWYNECSTWTASSFRIWISSAGIPSPPVALFIIMLPKAHLTSHSRMALGEWPHHLDYLSQKKTSWFPRKKEQIHVYVWLNHFVVHFITILLISYVCYVLCLAAQSFLTLQPHGLQLARVLCPWGFSWEVCWSRLPCPLPGDLPNPAIEPKSPTLRVEYFTFWATREAH